MAPDGFSYLPVRKQPAWRCRGNTHASRAEQNLRAAQRSSYSTYTLISGYSTYTLISKRSSKFSLISSENSQLKRLRFMVMKLPLSKGISAE